MSRLPLAAGLALPVALLAAFAGPAYTGQRDKSAGEPFAYAVPEGFARVSAPDARARPNREVWIHASLGNGGLVPNVSITHVNDMAAFDDVKLASIAAGMPAYFEGTQVTWHEVRHTQVKRPDGALVGLLEGENALGDVHFRSLQVSFPDDAGASLVTANFPSAEASHWEPIFEAAILSTRGVATRGVKPPLWSYLAWGSGGGLLSLGLLALLLLGGARAPADTTLSASERP